MLPSVWCPGLATQGVQLQYPPLISARLESFSLWRETVAITFFSDHTGTLVIRCSIPLTSERVCQWDIRSGSLFADLVR